MHPEVKQAKPGKCPKCGMKLVLSNSTERAELTHHAEKANYTPLLIIIGLILLVTLVVSWNDVQLGRFSWEQSMMYFMAGFFLIFSGFKLLDVGGFADGYSTYDLLAKRIHAYGLIYPFIELAFGLAYLVHFELPLVNRLVVVVLVFSGLGVLQSMIQKRTIQCACLGTIIKVPLSTVTLIEDFGMAFMALMLLIVR